MKTILIISILFFVQVSFSQLTIKKSSINSGGETIQNGNTYMLFTIGEVVVNENTNNSLQISEGFINPDTIEILSLSGYELDLEISIYPNPTADIVTIKFSEISKYEILIFDNLGKLIISKSTSSNQETIDLSDYSDAMYTLLVKNTINKSMHTSRIIKQ